MPAAKYDLFIDKGSTFRLAFTWYLYAGGPAKDLTGYTAKAQIRESAGAIDPPLSERTTAAGNIVLGGPAGTVVITWTAAETAAFAFADGDAVWDLEFTAGDGSVTYLLKGDVLLRERVTV